MSDRLQLALEAGLTCPEAGRIAVFHPRGGVDLAALPRARMLVIQPFRPDHDDYAAAGYEVVPRLPEGARFALALVCLPRAKAQARALVAQAAAVTDGVVVVDGAKTDGVDSLLRALRKRFDPAPPLAKAHGKIFWFPADAGDLSDWRAQSLGQVEGFRTAPGVFSADGVDPGSALLAAHLPRKLGRVAVDLGAGWGYLAARALALDSGLERLHLVEADRIALDCAEVNLRDRRARFHWADARGWNPPEPVDCVVMNPPFHSGRAADPGLGRAFIAAAARILAPRGQLWMVANRHLPYEAELGAHFAQVAELAGDARFKILQAARPSRPRG